MTGMTFATINGITLHARQEGNSDSRPLVFVNSLGADLRIWDGVVPPLGQQARLIRYDKRGHGLSDCPPPPYTMLDLARDLIGLLDHFDIEAATLIGSSVGGMVALQAAIAFPGRVKALLLSDTAARIGTPDYWQERIDTLRQHGMPYLADKILSRWFAPDFAEKRPAEYRGFYHMLTRMPLEGYIGTCAALRDADLRDNVGKINVPVLVLCGAADGATPPDLVRGLADSLPDARFRLIDGAGHTPSVENPVAMANAITQFLEGQGYG